MSACAPFEKSKSTIADSLGLLELEAHATFRLPAGAVGPICAAMAAFSPEERLEHLGETPPDTFPREILTEMISRLDEVVPALESAILGPGSFDHFR